MTKSIRIENADTSDHKVVVQTWQIPAVGPSIGPDIMINEQTLDNPTAMFTEYIHSNQYLVVKEV